MRAGRPFWSCPGHQVTSGGQPPPLKSQPPQTHISSLALSAACLLFAPRPSPSFSTVLGGDQCGHTDGLFILHPQLSLANRELHGRGEEAGRQWGWGICSSPSLGGKDRLIPQPLGPGGPCHTHSSAPPSSITPPSPHLSA